MGVLPNALVSAAFTIDFKSNKSYYPLETCPFTKINHLGIWRFGITEDREQAELKFVEIGSPADRAGLKDGDYLQRIHLENGEIIERFDETFFAHPEKHVFAPDGTVLHFEVLRGGKPLKLKAVTHKPFFTPIAFDE